jgi:replicative DNA helicase
MAKKRTENILAPPCSVELEKTVLACIVLSEDYLDSYYYLIKEELFFDETNRIIFSAVDKLVLSNKKVDLATVFAQLTAMKQVDKVPAIILSQLSNYVSGLTNIETHIRLLQELALKRSMIYSCQKAVSSCYDESTDSFEVFSEVQKELDNTIKNLISDTAKSIDLIHNEIVQEALSFLNSHQKSGIETDLTYLDNLTNGFQKSDLIIVAGRPAMGKTAFAISLAVAPAIKYNTPIAFFSLEMSSQQLVSRIQSQITGIDVSKIVKKQLTQDELNLIVEKGSQLLKAPLYIDDTPNLSILDLRHKAKRLYKERKIQMVIVDYLQLMRGTNKNSNREQEIAEISRGLKILAKELNIPVIALSQLSRVVETRTDKKPMLSDLRESGQIEQDADMVMFCWRPEVYLMTEYSAGGMSWDAKGLFMLIVAKHRNGELGEIPLRFVHELTKVDNYEQKKFVDIDVNREIKLKEVEIQEPKKNETDDFDFSGNNNEIPF